MQTPQNDQTLSGEWDNNPVYGSIKALVISQGLAPGTRIRLEPLADQLYVSNTPVREALIQLAAERLISDVPNAGFFTKKISESEMQDLCTLNQFMLDWALSVIRPEGQVPGMLKPPAVFDISKEAPAFSPQATVEMMDELFTHIARQSGNADVIHIVRNISERTYYLRLKEAELIDDIEEHLRLLCRTYFRQDINKLRQALTRFHEKRQAILPDVVRLIRLAQAAARTTGRSDGTSVPA